jgi:hypothetical protein
MTTFPVMGGQISTGLGTGLLSRGYDVSGREPFQNIITSKKTASWNEVPSAEFQILMSVETEYCKSLCMTHLSFIPGRFPVEAFTACMRTLNVAWAYSELKQIVVDVDERFFTEAIQVWRQVRNESTHEN